jgi:hypothetical protein
MWNSIKEDPILKTVVVVILGVLAFGFAFSIMFGGASSGMESGEMMGGGSYSLGNTLTYTLSLLIKIALILLVIGGIIAAIKLIKKYFIDETKFTAPDLSGKNSIYKYALYGAGALLVLVVLYSLMNGTNSSNMAVGTMQNNGYYVPRPASQFSILFILEFFVKSLLFLSITGLAVAAFMYFKNEYLNKNISVTNVVSEKLVEKKCGNCREVLKNSWKCCPSCGNEVEIIVEEVTKDTKETARFKESTILEEIVEVVLVKEEITEEEIVKEDFNLEENSAEEASNTKKNSSKRYKSKQNKK